MKTGILPPELKSISELLTSDVRYAVPRYQRNFAWTSDEVEDFWDDLCAAVARGSEYFLGTVVLQRKNHQPTEIIDGQQRLTCVSMVFSAIRGYFLSVKDDRAVQVFTSFLGAKGFNRAAAVSPKLQLNDINHETYLSMIVESRSISEIDEYLSKKKKSLDQSNVALLKAYRFLVEKVTTGAAKIGADADEKFIVPLLNCLRNAVKLIAIPVQSEEDANLFFESLNARGRELAVTDLLKNRLYAEARDEVVRMQKHWQTMVVELGRRPIPEYVRHYWIAKKATGLVREKELYKYIVQEIGGNQKAALDLASDLSSTASDYAKISDFDLWEEDSAYDADFNDAIDELKLYRVTQCNPILLNGIQVFKKPKDVAKLFRTVANFSFRYFIIGNQSPGNLERESNRIAEGIRNKTLKKPEEVAQAFAAISPDPTFRADFEVAQFTRSQAKLARHTLRKIADHLDSTTSKAGAENIVNRNAKAVNLEHVLPQSLGQKWKAGFSSGVDASQFIYRIGNLTLLTTKLNEKVAAADFSKKKKGALDVSELAINHYFRKLSQWTDKEIHARQVELAKVATEVWRL
ncbi:MAG: DUF262 domain-containing HNH endonuclease family protein [Nibricoccus sp.]